MTIFSFYYRAMKQLKCLDGVTALLIRLYLAPIFIMAGYSKLQLSAADVSGVSALFAKADVVAWFGNSQWGLGLPFPELLANLAAWTEFFGGWLLLLGLLTRLVSIPLLFTMMVAATTVHIDNGWFAITPTNAEISPAKVFSWLGSDRAEQSLVNSEQASERLARMRDILEENGHTSWLYEKGNIVILNNGIEFAATYFILLLALLLIGAGRFTSLDYYLYTYYLKPKLENNKYL
ncbi:DoxD-like inner membrane protein [Thalassotalea insulae]|uniref:DoxD-like inner membrane protein n=1 Tax=Thalassotalea insulae TaxID=2056778 RepID=A0ABQ6H0R9_9GAMM|nr:DoxX family protein [Thalassotalea insulae]GLX80335.1 DoxD-like inner membrane protein [Thalassotalea insulae]